MINQISSHTNRIRIPCLRYQLQEKRLILKKLLITKQ